MYVCMARESEREYLFLLLLVLESTSCVGGGEEGRRERDEVVWARAVLRAQGASFVFFFRTGGGDGVQQQVGEA